MPQQRRPKLHSRSHVAVRKHTQLRGVPAIAATGQEPLVVEVAYTECRFKVSTGGLLNSTIFDHLQPSDEREARPRKRQRFVL